jgi:hypothetical protein
MACEGGGYSAGRKCLPPSREAKEKKQVWIYCVVFVVATISPLVVTFFWVVFLLFVEVLWDVVELRVEH